MKSAIDTDAISKRGGDLQALQLISVKKERPPRACTAFRKAADVNKTINEE